MNARTSLPSRIFHGVLGLAIVALAVEILVRRWLYAQLPAQLPTPAVYGLLAADVLLLATFVGRRRK